MSICLLCHVNIWSAVGGMFVGGWLTNRHTHIHTRTQTHINCLWDLMLLAWWRTDKKRARPRLWDPLTVSAGNKDSVCEWGAGGFCEPRETIKMYLPPAINISQGLAVHSFISKYGSEIYFPKNSRESEWSPCSVHSCRVKVKQNQSHLG